MKPLLSFFIALAMTVISIPTQADEAIEESEPYAQYIFEVADKSSQTVFVDQANIRIQPHLNSSKIDSLNIGHQVTIIKKESVLKLGNRSANWYKVSYSKNHEQHTGYIWGANLSVGFRHIQGYDFLFGIAPKNNKKKTTSTLTDEHLVDMVVKVIKNDQQGDKLIQNVYFQAPPSSLSFAFFRWGDKTGLDGVEKLLIAGASGEACGIPTVEKYMLWSDDKLVALPTITSVSDAGVFYHSEAYLFPTNQGGKSGQIILNIEDGGELEELDGTLKQNDIRKKQTAYSWKKIGRELKVINSKK